MLLALNRLKPVKDPQRTLLVQDSAHLLSANVRHWRSNQRQRQVEWTKPHLGSSIGPMLQSRDYAGYQGQMIVVECESRLKKAAYTGL
jgi:hypothetical protein